MNHCNARMGAKRTGILGGTFDPIHVGHLDLALAVHRVLRLDEVVFLPAHTPPHRSEGPRASAYHRFAMVALATESHPAFPISDLELRSPTPSYTSITLDEMVGAGYLSTNLYFITGADAFAEIATWHDYPAVLDRSHFVVASRPGYSVLALKDRLTSLAGRMRQLDAESGVQPTEAAAPPSIFLVDTETADVSSTEIRARLLRGEHISGLVPEAVARYIRKHRLYSANTGDVLPSL